VTGAGASTRKRRAYAARVPPEERRRQLLDATLRLIAREGYGGVTVEAIAAEAGVTKPVVYGVYAKLPALLDELLERTQGEALAQLLAAFPTDADAAGDHLAADVTRAWAGTVRAHPDTWGPILLTEAQPPAVRERMEQGRRVVRDSIASMLASRGRGTSVTSRHRLAAEALVAAAEHFGRRLVTEPDTVDDEALAGLIDDLVHGALRRRPAAPRG
jgi:AcrR family transcriptional regulator